MPVILVTGAQGQVGQELFDLQRQYPAFRLLGVDLPELDLTQADQVKAFFHKHDIRYCLSCAAYTAVDRAESEPETARAVNVDAAATLAECCQAKEIPLIHLSTDYVYHNNENRPLREDSSTKAKGVYARTKLEGDQAVLHTHPGAMVIRTSWLYSAYGHNFVKTMIRLGKERGKVSVVFDQIGTPTYARDLAGAMLDIVSQLEDGTVSADVLGQVYHYANEGVTSWYDFALAIFDEEGIDCAVTPLESYQYPTPARRPYYSLMSKAKIKDTFGLAIPHWRSSLRHCLKRLELVQDEPAD